MYVFTDVIGSRQKVGEIFHPFALCERKQKLLKVNVIVNIVSVSRNKISGTFHRGIREVF